jgi:hypothetical protein
VTKPSRDRSDFRRGLLVAPGAIAAWIVLWCVAGMIGLAAGKVLVGPGSLDGYLAVTAIVGVCGVTPLALIAGFFRLLVKGRIVLFLVSGALVGLAITLWPLAIPSWR